MIPIEPSKTRTEFRRYTNKHQPESTLVPMNDTQLYMSYGGAFHLTNEGSILCFS